MAIVQGMAERIQGPIYDSVRIRPQETLGDVEASSTIRFFVNVQSKTKLETNLQAASLLPHYNTFEARAMRVVISDLPPEFPDDVKETLEGAPLETEDGDPFETAPPGTVEGNGTPVAVLADLELPIDRAVELLQAARDSVDGAVEIDLLDDTIVSKVYFATGNFPDPDVDAIIEQGALLKLSAGDLEDFLEQFGRKAPLEQQIDPGNGAGTLIGKIVYNSVISLYVGEKLMIQMPTWFFPAGAGPYSETARITTHGTPSPQDTFRFAEPIFIDKQQNFRVEMEIPDTDVLKELQRIYGPFYIWVVLDGYMTRGVQ